MSQKAIVSIERLVKASDESRQSTTTLASDAELQVPLAANLVYAFEFRWSFTTPTTITLQGPRQNSSCNQKIHRRTQRY